IRKGFDGVLRRRGVLGQLNITLEIGGWMAILAYVRDGFAAGIVSEVVVAESKSLIVRPLDPAVFPPIESRLIARRQARTGEGIDLPEGGMAWREALRNAIPARGASGASAP